MAWGAAQARSYLNQLADRLGAIADGTALSVTVHVEGRSFRRCRYHEHLIFFEETLDAIEIVRVLHPRRNIAAQLRDE
jgi:plasmid stabilization system protein ParE